MLRLVGVALILTFKGREEEPGSGDRARWLDRLLFAPVSVVNCVGRLLKVEVDRIAVSEAVTAVLNAGTPDARWVG